ncbi:unnamed protein product [Prorocentrum cordatum]|uniref:Uncharacterized protein n=1 Tax=Prorocentrum cordatum TaxID=2364126 RepID=A0ABN9U4R6_9DINO|nr:unnamed protein product [Polarella glacialis]
MAVLKARRVGGGPLVASLRRRPQLLLELLLRKASGKAAAAARGRARLPAGLVAVRCAGERAGRPGASQALKVITPARGKPVTRAMQRQIAGKAAPVGIKPVTWATLIRRNRVWA